MLTQFKIYPVHNSVDRPFWSVMIPTYNCANYLVETLKSVLEQDPGADQMQIEVVDDCSTKDDPETVVKEIGQGRVSLFRQPQNVGPPANFNTCIQRAKGHWVHILHGDDIVLQGFYRHLREGIEKETKLGAAFCRYIIMDENSHWKQLLSPIEKETSGILENFLKPLSIINRIMTPCIVVKRSVYEEIGGFNLELFHSADWDMWKRTILHYPVWYEPQTLACFRQHSASDTSRLQKSGENIREACRAIEIAQTYLPTDIAEELSNAAREAHAISALERTYQMLERGNLEVAISQMQAAIKCSQSSKTIELLCRIFPAFFRKLYELNLLPLTSLDLFLSEARFLSTLGENEEINSLDSHSYSDKIAKLFKEILCEREQKAICQQLKLKEINYIIFPNWLQSEDVLCQELAQVIKTLYSHPQATKITLLIDNSDITQENAELLLYSVVTDLIWNENLAYKAEIQISLINTLNEIQWRLTLPYIKAQIQLENENQNSIVTANAETIHKCKLEQII
jgi:glycosyltransferase involved in cell wall biosynthesis